MRIESAVIRPLLVALLVVGGIAGAVSCADRTTAPAGVVSKGAEAAGRDADRTEPLTTERRGDTALRADSAALDLRFSWVGVEHNKALAAALAQANPRLLRNAGKQAKCDAMDRALRAHYARSAATRTAPFDVEGVLEGHRFGLVQLGCATGATVSDASATSTTTVSFVPASYSMQGTWSLPTQAQTLISNIETAVDLASSPSGVQSAVAAIVPKASALGLIGSTTVNAAGSTAVSSSFYWNTYYSTGGGNDLDHQEPISIFQSFWSRARGAIKADIRGGVVALVGMCMASIPSPRCFTQYGMLEVFLGGASLGSLGHAMDLY